MAFVITEGKRKNDEKAGLLIEGDDLTAVAHIQGGAARDD